MFGMKPLYKIKCNDGRLYLFMYEYSENQMIKDRHRNGLSHYSYFKEQSLSIIKRDYDTVSCIRTIELTTIAYIKFLWYNLWSNENTMITVIPALKASYNMHKISESSINVTKKVIDNFRESKPKTIDMFTATSKDDLERLKKECIIYNDALVRYICADSTSRFYVYDNGVFSLLDTNINHSKFIDNSGNVSQDKT